MVPAGRDEREFMWNMPIEGRTALRHRIFAELGDGKVLGSRDLKARGLELLVKHGKYPGGKKYAISLRNKGREKIVVARVGVSLTFPHTRRKRRWSVFLDSGVPGWCGVKRLDALQPDTRFALLPEMRVSDETGEELPFHRSDLQTVVWDAASGEAVLVGFLRQRHGRNKVDIIPDKKASDIDCLEAWQEFALALPPGAVQPLDVLVVAKGRDPYGLLEQFGQSVRKHIDRRFDAAPVVGMMTWYGYATNIRLFFTFAERMAGIPGVV